MQRGLVVRFSVLLVLVASVCVSPAMAEEPPIVAQARLGTGFTYQGRLLDGGAGANGSYDLLFRLYDGADPATAAQISTDLELEDVDVSGGLFTVEVDFHANPFTGDERWLQVSVRPGASTGDYTALSPLTELTGTPYALGLRPGTYVRGDVAGAALEVVNTSDIAGIAAIVGRATNAAGAGYGVAAVSESADGYAFLGNGRSYFGDDVGIGVWDPGNRLHVADSISGSATLANHVALMENTSSAGNADVLALRINETTADIEGNNNFVTFFNAANADIGSIEGNGAGIVLKSGSGDYAEWLPRLDEGEVIEPGDIVGVYGGSVSKATEGAEQLLVVSMAPIIAAGDPGEEEEAAYELCAFVGQVPVRVRGPVTAGDFIIPSGLGDGTGIAVAPEAITAEQFAQVVGQAWETSADAGLKSVTVAVGLAQRDPTIARLVSQVQSQEAQLADIEARLTALEEQ